MRKPELIFCGGKNPGFAGIATGTGFQYGAQLPCTTYAPVYFADQDWKNPNREAYMRALAEHKPFIASVLDFEHSRQREEVLSWAEEAAQFSQIIMIIPKAIGEIERLPKTIGKSEIRLGYSIPTKHGGTTVPIEEFQGWPVHLLGGNPGTQMRLSKLMDVQSADGNMAMKMANRGLFWIPGKKPYKNRWWSLLESDGRRWEGNGNHEAFRRSCENIMEAWDGGLIIRHWGI